MPESITPILPHIPAFLLVMFRLTGLFIFAPMLASSAIPVRIKVLLGLVLAFCIYPMVPPQVPPELTVWTMGPAVAGELLIGVVIGYGASLPLIALQMGGLLMGQQLGLGLAQVFSPDFEEQTEVLSQFFFMVALAIFILLNGHHEMLRILVRSFETVPLGGYVPDESVLRVMVGLIGAMFEMAVRVAAPLLCLIFLETVAMGFIARTVPQFNILSFGFPMRIVVGLFLTIAMLATMHETLIESIRGAMRALAGLLT